MVCGYEYEQSFSRAFKDEFGMTPGKYRMTQPILNITPPIHDYGYACGSGLLFGPEFVMFPEITLIGTEHDIPYQDSLWLCPEVALRFWDHDRHLIHNMTNNHVYYGLTHHLGTGYSYSKYMTAVACDHTNKIPEGMKAESFGGYSCIKFHYIGRHHYRELSQKTAQAMYAAIGKYCHTEDPPSDIHLEKIDIDQKTDKDHMNTEVDKFLSENGLERDPSRPELGNIITSPLVQKIMGYEQMDYYTPIKARQ